MGLTLTAAARYLIGTSAWEVLDTPSRAANDLDEFVVSASKSPASGAVGVLVEDSDYAYIVFASNGGRPGRVLIGPESARDYKQGRTASERLNDQRDRPSSLFVDWARTFGFDVSPRVVEDIVGHEWTFAEDGVQALVELVGLRDLLGQPTGDLPGEARMLILGKTRMWAYVPGLLNDEVCGWIRQRVHRCVGSQQPGAPDQALRARTSGARRSNRHRDGSESA
jgi:hypothetical protein